MPGEFWYRSSKPINCPACAAPSYYESVWRPSCTEWADPSGFVLGVRKLAFSRFECAACGHAQDQEQAWLENRYPRGDGSAAVLKQRALWLAAQWFKDRAQAPQERQAIGRVALEGALDEALAILPDDPVLWRTRAELGGEAAPPAWRRALALAPQDPALVLAWARLLAALVRAQDGIGIDGEALGEYDPSPLDWISLFDGLAELGGAAQAAIAAALPGLAPSGATVVVASNASEEAFVRPAAGPQEPRLLAVALCLAGSAACRLSHQYAACQAWLAKATVFGPPSPGLADLHSLEQGLVYQAASHHSLAQAAFANARALVERGRAADAPAHEAAPPLDRFAALPDGQDSCPRCGARVGIFRHENPPHVVRSRSRPDPRSADVWYLSTSWKRCSCGHAWKDGAVSKRVETEF